MTPFKIKICGVRSVGEAEDAVAAGADAIGLNFCLASKRRVELIAAAEISRSIGGPTLKIGVFVNETPDQINRIADACRLDFVQLHGDESVDAFASRLDRPIIRSIAWRGLPADLVFAERWLEAAEDNLAAFLVDAFDPILRGGTGLSVDWAELFPRPELLSRCPLILAGGLNPNNVSRAICIARPDGVDVASGVEEDVARSLSIHSPTKSSEKMRAFVEAAYAGFAMIALKN